jgi:hypothetical protein
MDAPIAGLLLICLVAAPSRGLGQEAQYFRDANLSREEWRQRVEEARRRSEAYIANANARGQDAAPFHRASLQGK